MKIIKMKIINSQDLKGKELNKILNRGKADFASISLSVRKIIADVKARGDDALLLYTEKFDEVKLEKSKLKVAQRDLAEATKKIGTTQAIALKKAASNITCFHKQQIEKKWALEVADGVTIGQVTQPMSIVGVYAPGGRASYPSTILMTVIPAKIAGVKKVVVCSPPKTKEADDTSILAAAQIAGADEVYRIGGVQAIAAMAYGTETIPRVDKIVGPGNIYVTAAKREVSKDVAIDIPAGPSEILVIADKTGNASFIASDLLAQAEHDPHALAILVTTSKKLAMVVSEQINLQITTLTRAKIAETSIQNSGLIIIVKNVSEAIKYANLIAPEHLHIQTKNPHKILNRITNAGAVFLGAYSVTAFGDYSSGLNHVLPTGGYTKSYSGLSTRDFTKSINFMLCNKKGYDNLKNTTITLAKIEGFDGHAKSVLIRGKENGD